MKTEKDIMYEFFISSNISKYSGSALALAKMIYRKSNIIIPESVILNTIKRNSTINEYSLLITKSDRIVIRI